VLITGAAGGLGLAAARAAARHEGVRVLMGGRSAARARAAADEVGGEPVVLDHTSLAGVRECVRDLPPIDVLACNAGVKLVDRESTTVDGFEETFQVNHLSHLVLIDALVARGDPLNRIALVGSASHDPTQRGRMPPPLEGDIETFARGKSEAGARTASTQFYTTSKLMITAVALGLAREHPERHITCFDPGFMPGTGVAGAPLALRLLLAIRTALGFPTTTERSGRALAALLLDEPAPAPTGTVVDSRLRPGVTSPRVRDEDFQNDVIKVSRALAKAGATG
jgi:NAD(P)-dependent dehydrogenase (short-subunit alcohol dehydrogenase family)